MRFGEGAAEVDCYEYFLTFFLIFRYGPTLSFVNNAVPHESR